MANAFNNFTVRVINQYNFTRLFKLVWDRFIDFNVSQGGLKRSGIYNYNSLSSNSLVKNNPT